MTPEEAIGALKELQDAKLQGVIDLIREKDVLYTDRDTARQKAVEAALKAAQTGVDAAFAASEKAIGKSDINAEKWRENANEWRQAMMDRETRFASRTETENEFKSLRVELQTLRELQAQMLGRTRGISGTFNAIGALVSVIVGLIVIGTFVFITSRPAVPSLAPSVIYTPAPQGTQLPSLPPASVPR